MSDYPGKEELKTIREWNCIKDGCLGLARYIEAIWWMPEWGYRLKGKKVFRLELHTGGWSGNEEIIQALRQNRLFYAFCWEMSRKGGHHYFKIKKLSK